MKTYFLYPIICCFSLSLTAQQNNSINGKILFINSRKTPAVGVEISGKSEALGKANAVYSDSGGFYRLVFPKPGAGHVVELSVGDTDTDGQAIEVVNDTELRICRIPEDPSEPFEIIVCKKGERDLVAQKYYRVIKSSADKALAAKKAEYARLVAREKKDYKAIENLLKELDRLEKQADSISIYREAFRIASINKDNATKRVLNYLDLLEKGKSVREAREVLSVEKASEELEKSGSQFNAAIEELETRASASKSIFEYKDAIQCYDTIIYYTEKIGTDRLIRAGYYSKISLVFFNDGNYKTALDYAQKALRIRENSLPPKHSDLAVSYNDIGNFHHALGQYEAALKYFQKAISIYEENLDPKHPDLAASYNNIGTLYQALGQYGTALKYFQKAISILEAVLEPKHPDLATSYNNIGTLYQALGQYGTALEYHQKAISILEDILEPKHPDLASSYNKMGMIYQALGQYKTALEYFQKAISILEAVLEPKHPDLATSYNNIGTLYQNLGQYKTALEYYQKAISIWEAILEPNHPALAGSYNNIGSVYQTLGQYTTALEYLQRAISIQEEILEPKHPDLATLYNNIGYLHKLMGQYKTALEYFQRTLSIREAVLPPDHPALARIYNNIGLVYQALEQYKTALEYQQKAISIQEESLEPSHPDLGIYYMNIAKTYAAMKNFQKAISLQEKCLKIFEETLPENHPYQDKALNAMAEIYNAKGLSEYNTKAYLQAIESYKKAVTVSPKIKKSQYFYNNIGLAYAKNSQFNEARNAFTEYEKLFPKEGKTYRNWAVYYALQNDTEKALYNLQKAVELGYNDPEWLKTDDSMDVLRNEYAFIEIVEKLEKTNKK